VGAWAFEFRPKSGEGVDLPAVFGAVQQQSMAMLDNIVTMDESAVSFHTPETKQQPKQWLPKSQPGPIKAKVQASRTKKMVLAFFNAKGIIYINYMPKGTTVNGNYIMEALGKFMNIFRKKRPIMAEGQWFFHWDNAPVHTAAVVHDWLAARQVQMIEHPFTCLTWPQLTFSCFPSSRCSWLASP
jgi:hypothetical protein